jgi:hypothetical protein
MAKKQSKTKSRVHPGAGKHRAAPAAGQASTPQPANMAAQSAGAKHFLGALWTTPGVRKAVIWLLGPALLYAALFFIMQPDYFGHFSSGFYLDNGDGFQNVWNVWWVNHAVVGEHINPYFTTMLHWPGGTSLLPQTMNIYNGIVGIPLMHVFGFSLVQTVNFAVVFSFVFGGVTMFWFIQKLFDKYWVSLFAGALFTFSSFHFAHAQGHLQLVSFEFIPLFMLAFWTLLEKMRYRFALMASGALFLVLLCDYYYFLWCGIVAGLWFVWQFWKKQVKFTKQTIRVLAVFAITTLILVGPLVFGLLQLNKHDPLTGGHDPAMFSLDPVSALTPGGSWYWHSVTDGYTKHLPYLAETSVFFGYGLLLLLPMAFVGQFIKKNDTPAGLTFWWVILFAFGILALGPHLTIARHTLDSVPLPYAGLAHLLPTLQISGMPIRWILISLFAGIVLASWALTKINMRSAGSRMFVAFIVIISLVDLWPRALPLTPPSFQPYVYFLKQQPYGAVIDNGAMTGSEQLYNQTLHGKPIAFGYVTRLPKSVDEKDFHIFAALEQHRYNELCSVYKIRYVTLPAERPLQDITFPVIYHDHATLIYDVKNSPSC